MRRLRVGVQRLFDLSLVALAVGCGSVGYYWNANEDEAAKQERIRQERAESQKRRVEKAFHQLAKQYDLKVDPLLEKRDQILKLRQEMQSLSVKLMQRSKEVELEAEKLKNLLKMKQELQELALSLRQRRRNLLAEAEELQKLANMKEELEARSKNTWLSAARSEEELQLLSSKLQERNKELEAEIEELTRLVKLKEELQAKSQALGYPVLTDTGDPILKNDDSVQS